MTDTGVTGLTRIITVEDSIDVEEKSAAREIAASSVR
jgi:hypothetical protein